MIKHKKSDGTPCAGCPDTCEDRNIPIVIGGIECRGCCGLRGGPHGTFAFDVDGNVTQEPLCCAGYDHANKVCDPDLCGGHGGKPEWAVKVQGLTLPTNADPLMVRVVEARARKVVRAFEDLSGVNDPSRPGSSDERAMIVANGKVFRGGLRWNEDTGEIEAEAVVMEKRVNPHNPEAGGMEWHHRDLTGAERSQVQAALRVALGVN